MAVSVDSRAYYQSFASSILGAAKIQSKGNSLEISVRRRNSRCIDDIVVVKTRCFDQGIVHNNLRASSGSSSSSTSPASPAGASHSSSGSRSTTASDSTPSERAMRSPETSLREALWSRIEVTPGRRPDENSVIPAKKKSKSNGSEKSSGNLKKVRSFVSYLFGGRRSKRNKESGEEAVPVVGMMRVATGMLCFGDRGGKDERDIFSLADIKVQL